MSFVGHKISELHATSRLGIKEGQHCNVGNDLDLNVVPNIEFPVALARR